ncbi:MAG: alpha/beta fold hydrolase [Spirochaetota bacterium]
MNRRNFIVPTVALLALFALLAGCATPGPTPTQRLLTRYPPERPFPESRFASFGGINLHYRLWMPNDTPRGKLLLLHAAGASTVSFRTLAPTLAGAGYAVLAVDLPGFGFSDRALEFEHTASNRSGLVWSLADRLDTEDNGLPPTDGWTVAGHGMGGEVAVQMALDRPGRTRGLVLFATEVVGKQRPGRFFGFPPVRWSTRAWVENSLYTPEGVEELLSEAYGRPATEEEVDLYVAPLLRGQMPEAYVRYARTVGEMEFDLQSIPNPSLILWGEADPWIDPEIAVQTAERLPAATLVTIEGAAHLPMETHSSRVVDALLGWLVGL